MEYAKYLVELTTDDLFSRYLIVIAHSPKAVADYIISEYGYGWRGFHLLSERDVLAIRHGKTVDLTAST